MIITTSCRRTFCL